MRASASGPLYQVLIVACRFTLFHKRLGSFTTSQSSNSPPDTPELFTVLFPPSFLMSCLLSEHREQTGSSQVFASFVAFVVQSASIVLHIVVLSRSVVHFLSSDSHYSVSSRSSRRSAG